MMNRKQSWTFSMNTKCPKCREDVTFHGTLEHHPIEIILDGVFGVLGLTLGLPLLMMDSHDALRILGASLCHSEHVEPSRHDPAPGPPPDSQERLNEMAARAPDPATTGGPPGITRTITQVHQPVLIHSIREIRKQ